MTNGSSGVHVGVVVPMGGEAPVTDAARAAEDAGLDGLWSGDHLAYGDLPLLASTGLLSAAAAVTSRVTVGWSVMLPALRPAGWAAKEIATVQQISGGRLQLGVGIGPPGPEWRMAGTSATGRAARTDALLAALPDLLAGRPADPTPDGTGPTVTLDPAAPMPPLWIGGVSDAALRRTVRFGAGWLSSLLPPDDVAARARDLAALAEQAGAAPPRVGSVVFVVPGDGADPGPAVTLLQDRYGDDAAGAADAVAAGGPEQLAERFAGYRDAGADALVVLPFTADPIAAYDVLGKARALL